jgi:hypothetical protein
MSAGVYPNEGWDWQDSRCKVIELYDVEQTQSLSPKREAPLS